MLTPTTKAKVAAAFIKRPEELFSAKLLQALTSCRRGRLASALTELEEAGGIRQSTARSIAGRRHRVWKAGDRKELERAAQETEEMVGFSPPLLPPQGQSKLRCPACNRELKVIAGS